MMKLLLLCVVLTVIEARHTNVIPCTDTLTIQNVVYEKNILRAQVDSPYQLAIDYNTSTLFFSYTSRNEEVFTSVYFNLKDRSTGRISNVAGGFANAVDSQRQIVYIGGNDGIYQFDYDTKRAVKLQISDENIWQMFYKDGLYFTTYPEEKVYMYTKDQVKLVPEFNKIEAALVAIDNDNNFLYAQGGDLRIIKNGEDSLLGEYPVNALNIDIHGNVYFSTPKGIYRVKDKEVSLIVAIDNCYGFAIKADNTIIYATGDKVIELRPTNSMC